MVPKLEKNRTASKKVKNQGEPNDTSEPQTSMDTYLPVDSEASSSTGKQRQKSPTRVIQLTDYKTRTRNSIPSHADTRPARLQLMLYWRLLRGILNQDIPMLLDYWERIKCDVAYPFSERFKIDFKNIIVTNGLHLGFLDANCLLDMLQPF